ncbi:MAG: HAMP domain-containing histidine kinase [Chloroflexales bacterium]|nr:HAMP domain-containing histidine kinase [Chloroflexales bacterium]
MFNGLRLRLTLLYSAAALALVALVGGGVYLQLSRYFRQTTDLALQHKMVHEFYLLAATLPPDLAAADRDWSVVRGVVQRPNPEVISPREKRDDHKDEDDDGHEKGPVVADPWAGRQADLAFNAELAAIFVMPLDSGGRLLFDPNDTTPPIPPDRTALDQALTTGSDLRTVTDSDGQRIRLLTYRLTRDDGPVALQLGRVLGDQELVLSQMLTGILAMSAIGTVMIGGLSWWLAGRAVLPAQAAWDRQQSFVAGASHELRTPLTLIRASTEVALRVAPAAQTEQRELLGDVLRETDHMSCLVDDLLTLSRLDVGGLTLERATVELPEAISEVGRQVGRLAGERGLSLRVEVPPSRVLADPTRLRQILIILLDNALRHTPPGGAVTIVACPPAQPRSPTRIEVRDTGVGIGPEHLPHIFERFYRADEARGASSNAGLGLAIAQSLVQAMGGRIGAESAPGRGTTVWLTLPTAP